MNSGQTIFTQLIDHLPIHDFRLCVRRYHGNRRVRTFSCWDQFLCMAFAQLTFRESLRDIVTCLRSMDSKLYHLGIRGHVSRSTLARANENRDWPIYADFAAVLIGIARQLHLHDEVEVPLGQTVYAFHSTTIDLCLTLFPWAQFRRRKSPVKLHPLIDLRGNIPCSVHISSGRMAEVTSLDHLPIEAGAFYVMDRGYIDFRRLFAFTERFAVSIYLLVAIVKKRLGIDRSLGEILQILSIGIFEKTPILQAFSRDSVKMENEGCHKQLSLFDL